MSEENISSVFKTWDYESTIVQAQKILDAWEKSEEIYYMLSFWLFQRWRFSESIDVIQQAKIYNFESSRLGEIKLLIDFSLWKTDTILQDISSLRDDKKYDSEYLCNLECQVYVDIYWNYTHAIDLYKNYLEIYPKSGILRYYLGLLYYKQWKYTQAYQNFIVSLDRHFIYAYYGVIKCLKQNPDVCIYTLFFYNTFHGKQEFKNDYTCLWNVFYELWADSIALDFYHKSLHNIPNDYCTYNGIANILYRNKKFTQAYKYYLKTLYIRKSDSYALNGIWNILYQQKKYKEALSYYVKSYREKTENFYLLYKIGMCYYFLQSYDIAEQFLSESISLNSQNYMAQRYLQKTQQILQTLP